MYVAADVDAISRRVDERARDGQPTRVVVSRRTYRAPIEELWDALTGAERLPRWFLPVSGDLAVGGHYQFEGNAGGEVLACDKPDHAAVTWQMGERVSWLDVWLRQTADGTELVLEHEAPVDPEFWDQYGPGAVGVGWDLASLGLNTHLAEGTTVDPAESMAWLGSPEGRALIAATSAAWGEADIAAGREPEEARAAAERTAAFYTVPD